jgi:hypothetical protein
VVGEQRVIGKHVEEVVDLLDGLGDVNAYRY